MNATAVLLSRFTDQLFALMGSQADASALTEETTGHFHTADHDIPEIARSVSVAACILANVAADSTEDGLCSKIFSALGILGQPGELRTVGLLHDERLEERLREGILDRLPPHRQLLLLNRFFSAPRRVRPAHRVAAYSRLSAIQNDDPEAVLMFLAALATHDEQAAYPIQHDLLVGRFGIWVQELLNMVLSQEQRRYMARTMSRLDSAPLASRLTRILKGADSATLPPLLRAIGQTAGDDDAVARKAVKLFLRHKDASIRIAAVTALADMNAPDLTDSIATLWKTSSEIRAQLAALLILRPWNAIESVLRKLAGEDRRTCLKALLSLAAHLSPDLARKVGLPVSPPDTPRIIAGPPPRPPRTEAKAEPEDVSLAGKLKGLMGGQQDTAPLTSTEDQIKKLATGGTISDKTYSNVDLALSDFSGATFDAVTLKQAKLPHSSFSKVRFNKCTFTACDFSACRMKHTAFSGCIFKNCRFSSADLMRTSFTDCTLTGCLLDGVRFTGCELEGVAAHHSTLSAAHMKDTTVHSCQLSGLDFTFTVLENADFAGVEFFDALFLHTSFIGGSYLNTPAHACAFLQPTFSASVKCDEGAFLRAIATSEKKRIMDCADAACTHDAPNITLQPKLVLSHLKAWRQKRDLRDNIAEWLRANRRRKDWCRAKLDDKAADVLIMLPALIEAPFMPDGVTHAPGCVITSHTPTYSSRRMLEETLGIRGSATRQQDSSIRIEAFYSIGSIGSIAQTKRSDIDMWLCWDEKSIPQEDVFSFKEKLAAIEKWGEETHDLELHFFVMDLEKVRNNDFGFSDSESVGSSQALLLKEEFYRTAVCLAGKRLLWWATPTGADEKAYAVTRKLLEKPDFLPPDSFIDLGHLPNIPPEEFFGAALWQIVKALKSPFKSIMKFALLEVYTDSTDSRTLICERIKANITRGLRDFWHLDPYAMLFREALDHFNKGGRTEAASLLAMAFDTRTRFTHHSRVTGKQTAIRGFTAMEHFFPYTPPKIPLMGSSSYHADATFSSSGDAPQSFAEQKDLGKRVARFMFSTYENIRNGAGQEGGIHINEQDLTRLGRKIFAHFQKRPGKIMHIPFMNSPRGIFSSIHIFCEGRRGTVVDWVASGELAAHGAKNKVTEEMHREASPAALMVWLVANGIYSGGMPVTGQNLEAPVSLPNLADLLNALEHVFHHENVFSSSMEETLQKERVTKAIIIVNLQTERDDKAYHDVALVYTNNWGELFCITKPKGLEHLQENPRIFIKANTKAGIDSLTPISFWKPQKSLAPKINIEE